MGTCKQQEQSQGDRMTAEESNLMITGPPASRTVIDNLKKLLVQRQHSRESDTENNKNAARSNSGSNSDAAFYSQFSTSSSDSDDSSDDYMFFQEISNQATNGTSNHSGRRRHRRRRSYSSSSSSSPSPVTRSRRKVTRVNVTLTNSIGGDGGVEGVVKSATSPPASQELPSGLEEVRRHHQEHSKEERDSANSTSSHKDSSTSESEFPVGVAAQQGNKSLSSSAEAAGPVSAGRCPKFKSRRDRDRKRKRSDLNYATHRPKLLKAAEASEPVVPQQSCSSVDVTTSATGGASGSNTSVPTITVDSPSSTTMAADFALENVEVVPDAE